MLTLCTAGHIDHGKSSLIKSLTAIDPDRLPEEKDRGMTIDLGFAWFQSSSGEIVGIIDVPGHKNFIRNAIPGMGSIDAAMLVIAADDGWMPQTTEHVQILDLLGVKNGIVALTKVDLIDDPEWLDMVETDIGVRLSETSLKDAPIIRVSNKDGTGIKVVKEEIDRLVNRIVPCRDLGKPRLFIDRIFTIKGSGLVITGTLINGCLTCGDDVVVMPDGLTAHIRAIESYSKRVEKAMPGSRVALNLTNIKKEDLERGDVILAKKENISNIADVEVWLLPEADKIKNYAEYLVYIGTCEVMAKLVLIGEKSEDSSGVFFAQLQFEKNISMYIGERFILRDSSFASTVGGGTILDPLAIKYRVKSADSLSSFLKRRSGLELRELVLTEIEKNKYIEKEELLKNSYYSSLEISACVSQLVLEDKLLSKEPYIVGFIFWHEQLEKLLNFLNKDHKANPLNDGVPQSTMIAFLGIPRELFSQMISDLVKQGKIVQEGESISIATHKPKTTAEQEAMISDIKRLFEQNPSNPPTFKELITNITGSEKIVRFMCRQNMLMEFDDGILLEPQYYQKIKNDVVTFLKENGQITIQDFHSITGFSRKYTIPILAYMDKERITKREGERRVLC